MASLSDTFKYISHFRHAGHQVGRKVGDMLEVLTYAAIARDDEILSRLQVEPKLHGFSGAGHKVEFILLKDSSFNPDGSAKILNGGIITEPTDVIGFIECKRVGVEQTINTTFKNNFTKVGNTKSYRIPYNHPLKIGFGRSNKHSYILTFNTDETLEINKVGDPSFYISGSITNNDRIIFALSDNDHSEVILNESSLRSYDPTLQKCRILEIVSVNDDHVTTLLNDCLTGPQTPEKAKQASFVALDVRRKRFGSFDKRPNENEMISVLILTEFSHWEDKSQNMIKACIDKNFIVKDELIIEAFEEFENAFGADFYEYITKTNFEKNPDVRELALDIVDRYDGKIFLDLDDSLYKKFAISNNRLVFIS